MSKTSVEDTGTPSPLCCGRCRIPIREPHLLLANGQYWHEDCLRCACCDARLAELDKIFYVKADMPLCRRDYLRLYGQTGECVICHKRILAFEFVMRIHENVYHLNCFCCQRCHLRFCVGDKFYINKRTILCEQDYMDLSLLSLASSHLSNPELACLDGHPDCYLNKAFPQMNELIPTNDEIHRFTAYQKNIGHSAEGGLAIAASTFGVVGTSGTDGNIKLEDESAMKSRLSVLCAFAPDVRASLTSDVSDDRSSGYGSPSPSATNTS
ncbi:unnamed protein product [Calicophoron daubneyi]|uniref:LIM zinc-binding domain-containing protein n=1 Tax=Calicophoron daubneyi TaxID=300641 RepID=A0AAV2TEZ5_CALDB